MLHWYTAAENHYLTRSLPLRSWIAEICHYGYRPGFAVRYRNKHCGEVSTLEEGKAKIRELAQAEIAELQAYLEGEEADA